jgi:hypothetical protein
MGLPPFLIPFSTPELQCVIYIIAVSRNQYIETSIDVYDNENENM